MDLYFHMSQRKILVRMDVMRNFIFHKTIQDTEELELLTS